VTALPSSAVRAFQKTGIYEGRGALSQIEEDIGRIRWLDRRARRLAWAGALVPVPLVLIVVAFSLDKHHPSPTLLALSVVLFVVAVTVVRRLRRYEVETRRYEYANRLLRTLVLHPDAPLHVGIDLTALEAPSKVASRHGSWTYYRDPWFFAEGLLGNGICFRYARIAYLDAYSSSVTTHSGNVRTTRTRTSMQWRFEDAITLTYDPSRFPDVARLGPQVHAMLPLPQALEGRHIENTPGRIHLLVHGQFQWRATDAELAIGEPSVDAVVVAAQLLSALHTLLGTPCPVDFARAHALPSPVAIAPANAWLPYWLAPADAKLVLPTGLFAAGALVCLVTAFSSFRAAERADLYADGVAPRVKVARDCRRVSVYCDNEARLKSEESLFRDIAEERRVNALGYGIGGVLLATASAVGFVFWCVRRRREQARRTPAASWAHRQSAIPPETSMRWPLIQ
jgi:hypothetical protein